MSQISLCVIARDEESLLPGLLDSLQGVADQIVLVDTGSSDQTVAIAKAAGAVVVERPWDEDFSAARNAAIEHATGEWILVLDCDERLAPGATEAIRSAVSGDAFDLGMLPLHNAKTMQATPEGILSGAQREGDPVLLPRLIRRTADLRWEGAIHESIATWIAAKKRCITKIDAPILHFGYVPELLASRQKDNRNLKLLEKRCQQEPNNPVIRTQLAQAYLQGGQAMKAIEAVEQAWSCMTRSREAGGPQPAVVPLATLRAYIQLRTDEVQQALKTLEQAVAWGADHANLDILRGVCLETLALKQMGEPRKESLEAAKAFFAAALAKRDSSTSNERMPGATSWASLTRLATVHLMLGEIEEAKLRFADAIEEKPDHLEAQLGQAEAILFGGEPELALQLVGPHCSAGCVDAWVISACAADVMADTQKVRTYTKKAESLLSKPFISPHRRIQFEALLCASSIYSGTPRVGPGTLGVIGALMGRHPVVEEDVLVRRPNAAGIQSLVRNVVQAGQSELLDALFTRRAEALIPGIGEMVEAELSRIGGTVEDDGEPEYLFIGGAGRSGTTLLRAMLDAHENISVGPERKIIRTICGMRREWEQNAVVFEEAGISSEVLDDSVRAFISTLMESTGRGAKRVGEKTPPNLLYMDFLGRIYPQARFIHVIRDGRAVGASLLKQDWRDMTTGQPIEYCSDPEMAGKYWVAMVQEIRAQAASVPGRYLEIRYEDLVNQPRETMATVLAFLDEPWDDAVLSHQDSQVELPDTESSSAQVSQPIHTRSVSRWKSELSSSDRAKIESWATPMLKELGYVA